MGLCPSLSSPGDVPEDPSSTLTMTRAGPGFSPSLTGRPLGFSEGAAGGSPFPGWAKFSRETGGETTFPRGDAPGHLRGLRGFPRSQAFPLRVGAAKGSRVRVQARDSQTAQQVDGPDPPPETRPALKTLRGRFSRRHIFALKLISEALRPGFSGLHVREGQRIPERLGVRQSRTPLHPACASSRESPVWPDPLVTPRP